MMLDTMSFLFFGLIGMVVAINPTINVETTEVDTTWDKWVSDFKKIYENEAERIERKAIFVENFIHILQHNAEAEVRLHNYTLGLNAFADLTSAEFADKYLSKFSTLSESHTVILPDTDVQSIDWRELGAVTPVKDQGQCGSCWSFSATGSMEGAHFKVHDELVSLSEQQLVDCANKLNQGCNGGMMDYAFKYVIKNNGITTESNYPYTAMDGTCNTEDSAVSAVMIDDYNDVPENDESQLMAAVSNQPVSVAIDAEGRSFQLYKSGVYNDKCGTNLDHGVLVVGYGTEDGLDYWIVKNSWGESWGDEGYIKMARNTKDKEGQCGIAMQPSYPLAV